MTYFYKMMIALYFFLYILHESYFHSGCLKWNFSRMHLFICKNMNVICSALGKFYPSYYLFNIFENVRIYFYFLNLRKKSITTFSKILKAEEIFRIHIYSYQQLSGMTLQQFFVELRNYAIWQVIVFITHATFSSS